MSFTLYVPRRILTQSQLVPRIMRVRCSGNRAHRIGVVEDHLSCLANSLFRKKAVLENVGRKGFGYSSSAPSEANVVDVKGVCIV